MLPGHNVTFFESLPLTIGVCVAAMLLGLVAGSMIHALAWSMTHNDSNSPLTRVCRKCGHPFSFRESIPLIGWLSQRGTCSYCGEPLGSDGVLTELLCSAVYTGIVLRFGLSPQTLEVLAITSVLMVIALVSLIDYRVPNSCIVMAFLIRICYIGALAVGGEDVSQMALASVVGAFALSIPLAIAVFLSNAMLARDVSGMGTVKLVAVVGFYLGWQQGLLALAVALGIWLVVLILSPTKLLDVEVEGGAHRASAENGSTNLASMRDMKASMEEDIAEPMRLIPFAPPIAIALWGVLLLGVVPSAWNAPLF